MARRLILFEGRDAEVQEHAHLNCMAHMLSLIPYKDLTPEREDLSPRKEVEAGYVRSLMSEQNLVPQVYGRNEAQQ